MNKPRDTQSFLLRLWRRAADGGYCALLHSVQTDERHSFADLEALIQYLRTLDTEASPGLPEANAPLSSTIDSPKRS